MVPHTLQSHLILIYKTVSKTFICEEIEVTIFGPKFFFAV